MFHRLLIALFLSCIYNLASAMPLYYVFNTEMEKQEVIENILDKIADYNLIHLANFYYQDNNITQINFCNASYGKPLIQQHKETISTFFPCGRASIYQEGGKTKVSLFDPSFLVKLVNPSPELSQQALVSETTFVQMIKEALNNAQPEQIIYSKQALSLENAILQTITIPSSQSIYQIANNLSQAFKKDPSLKIEVDMFYKKKKIVQLNLCSYDLMEQLIQKHSQTVTALFPCKKISIYQENNTIKLEQNNIATLAHLLDDEALIEMATQLQKTVDAIIVETLSTEVAYLQ